MRQDGYTAMEALAALAIIGFAVGGLAAGMQVVGRGQLATTSSLADAVDLRATRDVLDLHLGPLGPFRSDHPQDLHGDASHVSYACGGGNCEVRAADAGVVLFRGDGSATALRIPHLGRLRLSYVSDLGSSDVWPPVQPPPPAPQWEVLRDVAFVDETAQGWVPVLSTRLWREQTPACEFDPISRDCRGGGR